MAKAYRDVRRPPFAAACAAIPAAGSPRAAIAAAAIAAAIGAAIAAVAAVSPIDAAIAASASTLYHYHCWWPSVWRCPLWRLLYYLC